MTSTTETNVPLEGPTPDDGLRAAEQSGPMLAADGTPLKRSLARALRREKLRALMLIAPLLLPLMTAIGVSPVQFAAIMGVNTAMGGVTPPYASILYLGARIGKVKVTKVIPPAMFLIVTGYVPVVFLTSFWPDLSLYLPRLFGY